MAGRGVCGKKGLFCLASIPESFSWLEPGLTAIIQCEPGLTAIIQCEPGLTAIIQSRTVWSVMLLVRASTCWWSELFAFVRCWWFFSPFQIFVLPVICDTDFGASFGVVGGRRGLCRHSQLLPLFIGKSSFSNVFKILKLLTCVVTKGLDTEPTVHLTAQPVPPLLCSSQKMGWTSLLCKCCAKGS